VGQRSAHKHRFSDEPRHLRSEARVARLESDRVVALSRDGASLDSVLDVGTGTGLFAEAFISAGMTATGLDVNPDLLAVARVHLPHGLLVGGSAEGLPFEDASFDLVFLGNVLHEAENALKALEEARRVARTRVAVLEWPYRKEESGPPLTHRLKPKRIKELAESAGLRDLERLRLKHMDLYRFRP
jgi:ubiquinone/menaquinone biosynthesis C-methylase UbiE